MHVSSSTSSTFEVEEKFSLMNQNISNVDEQLHQLGFRSSSCIKMADFYYDSVHFDLIRQDCWLRYRDTNMGSFWQLKRGQQQQLTSLPATTGATTVYEETEGNRALELVATLLLNKDQSRMGFTDHASPALVGPQDFVLPPQISKLGLSAFAEIVTQRSSWQADHGKFSRLTVDLDATEDGYALGEVETVVQEMGQVQEARLLVHELIHTLQIRTKDKTIGKMEYYLQRHRPDVHKLCVDCGVV